MESLSEERRNRELMMVPSAPIEVDGAMQMVIDGNKALKEINFQVSERLQ